AEPDLPAREIDPQEARRAMEEFADLVERELVARLHLPDVAGLALVVAPERDAERQLVGVRRPVDVRFEGARGERGIGGDAHGSCPRTLTRPARELSPRGCARATVRRPAIDNARAALV